MNQYNKLSEMVDGNTLETSNANPKIENEKNAPVRCVACDLLVLFMLLVPKGL